MLSGTILRPRCAQYWIAIQPADCRGAGVWWPQRQPLTFDDVGNWTLERTTLGRDGVEGDRLDIGKTYTIALFELTATAHAEFSRVAQTGERLKIPKGSRLLCSIEVKRVKYVG